MISEREAAKYPFLIEAVNLVKTVNPRLEELSNPNYMKALKRGAQRVIEAIISGEVSINLSNPIIELLSFPIANMFVTIIEDEFLSRRYALSEAVRIYKLLVEESEERIIHIATQELSWDIQLDRSTIDGQSFNYSLSFNDYLNAASGFREKKWKLINRLMVEGYVKISKIDAARLIQFEVEDFIQENVSQHVNISLPEPVHDFLEKITKVFEENRNRIGEKSLPKEVLNEAFPPCMKYCLESLLAGRRASHMERFGLTSFLVHVGMNINRIIELYNSVTDFDESMTRYQIEHIAGLRGTRTKYTPPTCSTLRTHGICRNKDALCEKIKHPLAYYRNKAKNLAQQTNKVHHAKVSNLTE